jgi:hypothetical protein
MDGADQLGQLNIELVGIGKLIGSKHAVPKNQREFAWEDKHVNEFINDVTGAQAEDKSEYFLGTVVLTDAGKGTEVVDGQQRMATACILVAAARDYLINTKDTDNIESGSLLSREYLLHKDPKTLEINPFFELNEIDNEYFRKHIIEEPKDKTSTSFQKEIPSHVRLKRAYEMAYEAVKRIAEAPPSKPRDQLNDLIAYLKKNVKVIALVARDEASAFTLFETLNDRGLELAISDLLKNFLLGRSKTRLDEVRAKWLSMKTTLESADAGDKVVMYIRQLWCSQNGLVRDKDLYSTIKKTIANPAKAVAFADTLAKNAKTYSALLNADQDFWKQYGFNTYKSIRALNILAHTQPRPLLLAILGNFAAAEITKAIKVIESWSFRFSITNRLGGEGMEREYSKLAKEIHEGTIKNTKQLVATMKLVPNDADFKEAFQKYALRKSVLARYVLIELERTKNGDQKLEYIPNDNPEDVNLEHVLPHTFPAAGWGSFDEETHAAYANRLGNLTIMNSDDNVAADQAEFVEKKKFYAKSEIKITKEINTFKDWTIAEIEKRQNSLADLAVTRWP